MTTTTTRLVTLGLLQRRPMHGYEITQVMSMSGLARWADVLPGSIYYALAKMESEGLLSVESEEQAGGQLRKIYALTRDGRAELRELIRGAIGRPPHNLRSDLALAACWIHLLNADEATGLLTEARSAIEGAQQERTTRRTAKRDLSPMNKALFDNADAIEAADLVLLDRIQALIAAGQHVD